MLIGHLWLNFLQISHNWSIAIAPITALIYEIPHSFSILIRTITQNIHLHPNRIELIDAGFTLLPRPNNNERFKTLFRYNKNIILRIISHHPLLNHT